MVTTDPVFCLPKGYIPARSMSSSPSTTPPLVGHQSLAPFPMSPSSPLVPRGSTSCAPFTPFAPFSLLSPPSSADPSIQNLYQSPPIDAGPTPPPNTMSYAEAEHQLSLQWATRMRNPNTSTNSPHSSSIPSHSPSAQAPTLATMFAEVPGCKRKRSVQDFGGISMDCIRAAASKGDGAREVISPRRVLAQVQGHQPMTPRDDASDTSASSNDADVSMDEDDEESDDEDDIEFCLIAI